MNAEKLYPLRALKGAPLSCLIALYLSSHALRVKELQRYTGYTDKPVSEALTLLSEMGIAQRNHRGWYIPDGVQLPLPLKSRKNSDSLYSSSSSLNKNQLESTTTTKEKSRKNSDFFQKNHETALRCGIREPMATEIARLDHVTPEYIEQHIEGAANEEHPLGAAIYRIKHGWEIPKTSKDYTSYTSGEYADFIES